MNTVEVVFPMELPRCHSASIAFENLLHHGWKQKEKLEEKTNPLNQFVVN